MELNQISFQETSPESLTTPKGKSPQDSVSTGYPPSGSGSTVTIFSTPNTSVSILQCVYVYLFQSPLFVIEYGS